MDLQWEQRQRSVFPVTATLPAGVSRGAWWVECLLTRARWGTAATALVLFIIAPGFSRLALTLLTLFFFLGNLATVALLRPPVTRQRWVAARLLGIGVDWIGVLALLTLFHASIPVGTALGILLIGIMALRSGKRGALISTGACSLMLTACAAHWLIVHDVNPDQIIPVLLGSIVLFCLSGTTFGIVIQGLSESYFLTALLHEQVSTGSPPVTAAPPPARATSPAEPVLEDRRAVCWMTDRELEVLVLLANPKFTYTDIAARLNPPVSVHTVKTHVRRIADKLGSERTREDVVTMARRRGILHPELPLLVDPPTRLLLNHPGENPAPPAPPQTPPNA